MKLKLFLLATLVFSLLVNDQPNAGANAQALNPPAILLFIGDGLGEAHRTAARWSSVGQGGQLNMDQFPYTSWTKTASADNAVTDSAAAATALATGIKTNNGILGMDPNGTLWTTILEWAQDRGFAVGLVTTTEVSDATPAGFASHILDRDQTTDIVLQMIEHRPNVLLGGGEDEFLPSNTTGCYPKPGVRTDGRNLIQEAITEGYTYVCTEAAFNAIDPLSTTYLLGLFGDNGMARPYKPSMAKMTAKAISILSPDPDGFFLMVEGGRLDKAAHNNDAVNVIQDTLAFDAAIQIGINYAATNTNAIVIVTGDHETGGMSVSLTSSGKPDEDGPFEMPNGTPFYINWTTTFHTGVDVPTTASGYLGDQLLGTYENTHIYEVMRRVIGWNIWMPIINK